MTNPCMNGGTCDPSTDIDRGFTCTCSDGYTGSTCTVSFYSIRLNR